MDTKADDDELTSTKTGDATKRVLETLTRARKREDAALCGRDTCVCVPEAPIDDVAVRMYVCMYVCMYVR